MKNFLCANKNPPSQIPVSTPEYAIMYENVHLTQVMLSNEDLCYQNIFVRTFRLGKPSSAVQLRDNVQMVDISKLDRNSHACVCVTNK